MHGKVQVHADKFEELIDRRGRSVAWEEAVICSCWNTDSGQPSYSCKACHGKGYVYQPPVEVNALVTSVTLNKEYQEMAGVFEVGDAVMTVPKRIPRRMPNGQYNLNEFDDNPMFEISMWDKITLLDDEYKTSEVLLHNVPMYGREADALTDKVVRLKHIRKYNQETGEITQYILGADFNVVDGNRVVWLDGGRAPADGEQYSVTYFHKPVYIVTATLPKPRHQDGQDLPRYVALRYLGAGVERK